MGEQRPELRVGSVREREGWEEEPLSTAPSSARDLSRAATPSDFQSHGVTRLRMHLVWQFLRFSQVLLGKGR